MVHMGDVIDLRVGRRVAHSQASSLCIPTGADKPAALGANLGKQTQLLLPFVLGDVLGA